MYRSRTNKDTPQAISSRLETKEVTFLSLQQQHDDLLATLNATEGDLPEDYEFYEILVKQSIKSLKEYNECKDIAMGLIAMIADMRGVRIREIMQEIDVEDDD